MWCTEEKETLLCMGHVVCVEWRKEEMADSWDTLRELIGKNYLTRGGDSPRERTVRAKRDCVREQVEPTPKREREAGLSACGTNSRPGVHHIEGKLFKNLIF